jgi:hypothetical protein
MKYNKCDCGGEKAKSPHSHWCSSHTEDFSMEALIETLKEPQLEYPAFSVGRHVVSNFTPTNQEFVVETTRYGSAPAKWQVIRDQSGKEIGRLFISYV